MAKMYAIVRTTYDHGNTHMDIVGLVSDRTVAEENVIAHQNALRVLPSLEDNDDVVQVRGVSAAISMWELEVGVVDAPPVIGYIVHQAPNDLNPQAVWFNPATGSPIDYFSACGYNTPPMDVVLAAIAAPGSVQCYEGKNYNWRNSQDRTARVFFSLSLEEARKAASSDEYKQQRIDAQRAAMHRLDGMDLSGLLSDTTHVPHTDNN